MGSEGFTTAEAKAALADMGVTVSDATVKTQLYLGKKKPGAVLSDLQKKYLHQFKNGTKVPTSPPAPPAGPKPPVTPPVTPPITPPVAPPVAEDPSQWKVGTYKKEKEARSHLYSRYKIRLAKTTGLTNEQVVAVTNEMEEQLIYMKQFDGRLGQRLTTKGMKLELHAGKTMQDIVNQQVYGVWYQAQKRMGLAAGLEVQKNFVPTVGKGTWNVGSDFGTVFRHEYGHRFHGEMTPSQDVQWTSIADNYVGLNIHKGQTAVSRYAATNERELFAECFAAFTSRKYVRGSLPSDIEKFLDKVVGKAPPITATVVKEPVVKILKTNIGGSTGAKLVEVTPVSGKPFKAVMKEYRGNEVQVKNEFLANKLYNEFGLGTPAPETLVLQQNGKAVLVTKFEEDARTFDKLSSLSVEYTAAKKEAEKNFVLDAWLANWDSVGLTKDNIAVTANGVKRLDNGGALLFRAQGSPKGAAFGKKVTELQTLRDAYKNPAAAEVFAGINDEKLVNLIDDFEKRVKARGGLANLSKMIETAGFDDITRRHLEVTLRDRYSDIIRQRDELKKAMALAKAGSPANTGTIHHTYQALKDDPVFKKHLAGLSNEEHSALFDFTVSGYIQMNKNALKGITTSDMLALDRALSKLPGFDGWSARGISYMADLDAKWKQFTSGNWAHVEWKAYSSTSIKPGKEFGSHSGICFLIKSNTKQAAYVDPLSGNKGEYELLVKRNSRYKIVGYAEADAANPYGFGTMGHKKILVLEELAEGEALPMQQAAPPKLDGKALWAEYERRARAAGVVK